MEKDHLERKYRKSPGRQYGYEYDPLSRSGESSASRSGASLAQRPDPRRTRQLMRQSIIASKRPIHDEEDAEEPIYPEIEQPRPKATRRFRQPQHVLPYHDREEMLSDAPSNRYASQPSHSGRLAAPRLPSTSELMDQDEYGEEEPVYARREEAYYEEYPEEYPVEEPVRPSPRPTRRDLRTRTFVHEEEQGIADYPYDEPASPIPVEREYAPVRKKTRGGVRGGDKEYIYEEDEELPPGLHPVKKKGGGMSRRGLLLGAAGVAVGAAAVTMLPRALPDVGGIIDEAGDRFSEGVTEGAETARKEIIEAMYNVEGFTLDAAIGAARLTRSTYDVIVSPVIEFGSTLSEDFLLAMLNAMKSARGSLAQIYQDNVTLAAIQKVLESWVEQVDKLPKQLDLITQTDLDGAQAYLQALKRTLEEEKKKLDEPQQTPTPQNGTPGATPQGTPQEQSGTPTQQPPAQ